MKKALQNISVIVLVLLISSSCLKNKLEPTGNEDVIFSAYDIDSDFSTYLKYVMVDSIGKIDLSQPNSTDTLVEEPYRTEILNQIELNLTNFGYIRVDSLDSADVFINVNALINPSGEMVDQYSLIDGNGVYQSVWWQNQHYIGAPNYWGFTAIALYEYQIPTYFTANSGTLIIEMLDISSLDTSNQTIFVPWFAGIRSVLTGGDISNRIKQGIDQCFNQSQYLKH
jgi:hypothetical protein